MELKNGDIVENRWAGHYAARFFIYTGTKGEYVEGVECNNTLKKVQYYKSAITELFHDGKPAFKVVGHSDGFEKLKRDLKLYQNAYRITK